MTLPEMPTGHPGSIFQLRCSPSVTWSVPNGSTGGAIIYPGFSTVMMTTSWVTSVAPTGTKYHTPTFLTSAASAVRETGSPLPYRWTKLCTEMVCTNALASVGGGVYVRRAMTTTSSPTVSYANALAFAKEVWATGSLMPVENLTKGTCMHSIINNRKAVDFCHVPDTWLYTSSSTIPPAADTSESQWLFPVVAGNQTSEVADALETLWQPIYVVVDNTTGAVPLTFAFKFDCVVEYLASPSSFLCANPSRVPRGDPGEYVRASHLLSTLPLALPLMGKSVRDPSGYLGRSGGKQKKAPARKRAGMPAPPSAPRVPKPSFSAKAVAQEAVKATLAGAALGRIVQITRRNRRRGRTELR